MFITEDGKSAVERAFTQQSWYFPNWVFSPEKQKQPMNETRERGGVAQETEKQPPCSISCRRKTRKMLRGKEEKSRKKKKRAKQETFLIKEDNSKPKSVHYKRGN